MIGIKNQNVGKMYIKCLRLRHIKATLRCSDILLYGKEDSFAFTTFIHLGTLFPT